MDNKPWLPRGTKLYNDQIVNKLISEGQCWQIILSTFNNFILLVKPVLYSKWIANDLISDSFFQNMTYSNNEYLIFCSKSDYIISSAEFGPYPDNVLSAHAFALALKETRNTNNNASLHDSIFIEQISRLLPTYTISESYGDDLLLGKWLSGGVNISIKNTNRLCSLLSWMDKSIVLSLIKEAGLEATSIQTMSKNEYSIKNENENDFEIKGRPELSKFFNEHIIDIIKNSEKYKRMGINFPSAIILHGPPGCGKTFAVDKLVNYLDWPNYYISSATIGSPYIHDTSKKISEIFDKAIESSPSIIVIDEMEAFLSSRNTAKSSGLHHTEEVAEFLRRIPDAANKNVLIIAMTNMIDAIDPAILRRGRFDHILEVKMPSLVEIEELLISILNKIPHEDSIDIKDISLKLQNRPLSDVAFAIKEACFYAAKNDIEYLNNDMLINAIKQLPPVKNDEKKIGFGVN
jgi:ATP-dependent 26S proteasome regulatory subunit